MNTPAHVVINLLVLSGKSNHRRSAVIVVGALIPDLVIILFYAWHKFIGTVESQIWSVEYYRPLWQAWIDGFNSIPLILLALLICWKTQKPLLTILFASMLLHTFGDLPLHHDDGHAHFYPFTDWRFASPISYWDRAHYGHWVSWVEIASVSLASLYLFWHKPQTRVWVGCSFLAYLLYLTYVMLVWA